MKPILPVILSIISCTNLASIAETLASKAAFPASERISCTDLTPVPVTFVPS